MEQLGPMKVVSNDYLQHNLQQRQPPTLPTNSAAMVPPTNNTLVQVCADSGTTDTLFRMSDSVIATNIKPFTGFRVRVANNTIITSTHIGYINVPNTPGAKKDTYFS